MVSSLDAATRVDAVQASAALLSYWLMKPHSWCRKSTLNDVTPLVERVIGASSDPIASACETQMGSLMRSWARLEGVRSPMARVGRVQWYRQSRRVWESQLPMPWIEGKPSPWIALRCVHLLESGWKRREIERTFGIGRATLQRRLELVCTDARYSDAWESTSVWNRTPKMNEAGQRGATDPQNISDFFLNKLGPPYV